MESFLQPLPIYPMTLWRVTQDPIPLQGESVLGRRGNLSSPLQFVQSQENPGAGPVWTTSSFLEVSTLIKWVSLAHTLGFWSIFQRLSSFYGNSCCHKPEAFNAGCCSVQDKPCRSLVSKYSHPSSPPPLISCPSAFIFLTNNSGEKMTFFFFSVFFLWEPREKGELGSVMRGTWAPSPFPCLFLASQRWLPVWDQVQQTLAWDVFGSFFITHLKTLKKRKTFWLLISHSSSVSGTCDIPGHSYPRFVGIQKR